MAILINIKSTSNALQKNCELTFDQEKIIIGRGKICDIVLPDASVSYHHAVLIRSGANYFILDEQSTNGTILNNEKLIQGRKKVLRNGDCINILNFKLEIKLGVSMQGMQSSEKTLTIARQILKESIESINRDGNSGPNLLILNGQQEGSCFLLPPPISEVYIGRGEDCNIILYDQDASRQHAMLKINWEYIEIQDMESKNGILINDKKYNQVKLHDRDEIVIGSTRLVFNDPLEAKLNEILSMNESYTTVIEKKNVAEQATQLLEISGELENKEDKKIVDKIVVEDKNKDTEKREVNEANDRGESKEDKSVPQIISDNKTLEAKEEKQADKKSEKKIDNKKTDHSDLIIISVGIAALIGCIILLVIIFK